VIVTGAGALQTGQWYYVAIIKKDDITYMYLDGLLVGQMNDTVDYSQVNFPKTLHLGEVYDNDSGYYFNGLIDDLRITKGVARYIDNTFSPVFNNFLLDWLRPSHSFGGVKLDYQEKRIIPSVSSAGHLSATDLTWTPILLTETSFEGTTESQTSVSGSVGADILMGGHATTLKPSGDCSFFIDAEL
jgi:hypothetical protein